MVSRIGEEQDHAGHCSVALLERDPPLEGLDVAHVRLGLDPHPHTWPVDASVPRSVVDDPGCRQLNYGHFLTPLQLRVDAFPEPSQQRQLARIPNGRASREGPRRQLKADRLQHLRGSDDRHIRRSTAADPRNLTGAEVQRTSDCCITRPSGETRGLCVSHQQLDGLAAAIRSANSWAPTRRHVPMVSRRAHRVLIPRLRVPHRWTRRLLHATATEGPADVSHAVAAVGEGGSDSKGRSSREVP